MNSKDTRAKTRRDMVIEEVANAVSLIASGAANRQVCDPLAREISDAEHTGHRRLVRALKRLLVGGEGNG